MILKDSITFTVWQNDPPMEIQLEPEAIIITVNPGEEVTFAVKDLFKDFSWAIRCSKDGIQLFPEPLGSYGRIEIYRNGKRSDELDFLYEY